MDTPWKTALWRQFGAAIDMIGNAVAACPDDLWHDRTRRPEFWYTVFHTLFFLDLYLSGKLEGFAPPAPFTLSELDPAGVLPERPYTKSELLPYLRHCREKRRTVIDALTAEKSAEPAAAPRGAVESVASPGIGHGARLGFAGMRAADPSPSRQASSKRCHLPRRSESPLLEEQA
ncbi:MAG: DinB family protein [Bryobacterales bacterium]|nr:DinB family protein [Bryobacterales bacterium]